MKMFLSFNKNDYESLHKAFYLKKINDYGEEEKGDELDFDEFCLPFSGKI